MTATVDFLLTAKRDRKAPLRFLRKAIGHNGTPEKITIDKSQYGSDRKLQRRDHRFERPRQSRPEQVRSPGRWIRSGRNTPSGAAGLTALQ